MKGEPFLLVLGDEILDSNENCSKELIEYYNNIKFQIIAVKGVEEKNKSSYGIVEGREVDNRLFLIEKMIEKPEITETKSNLAIIGRYVLNYSVFKTLKYEI